MSVGEFTLCATVGASVVMLILGYLVGFMIGYESAKHER